MQHHTTVTAITYQLKRNKALKVWFTIIDDEIFSTDCLQRQLQLWRCWNSSVEKGTVKWIAIRAFFQLNCAALWTSLARLCFLPAISYYSVSSIQKETFSEQTEEIVLMSWKVGLHENSSAANNLFLWQLVLLKIKIIWKCLLRVFSNLNTAFA